MRYKIVPAPEPGGLDTLLSVQRAVPLVPKPVEDCCTRIRDRTAVSSRDAARRWLTFCVALELVEETDRGYHRRSGEPDREALAEAFGDRVFAAREVRGALPRGSEADPPSTETVFAAVRESVPRWERDRVQDWESEWTERVRRLLEWWVAFGAVERIEEGYRRSGSRSG
ncbi:MAG: hypothetical protein ABEH56_03145 [Salinirussus sp.]